jgi:hypothetical protein
MTTTISSRGNTETARYLERASQGMGQHFLKSVALGKQSAHDELGIVWNECKKPNWDGCGALAIQPATFCNAYLFIEVLPLGCPLPSVGVEADGHLTLEWYRHSRWTLSISVSPEGILYFAALFGASDVRGSEPFLGVISKSLLDLIQRVHIQPAALHD